MIEWWLIFPVLTISIVLNRLRGENGGVPHIIYVALMANVATFACRPPVGYGAWIYGVWWVYFFGYAILPWQAMLAGCVDLAAPGRKDGFWQWMQNLATACMNFPFPVKEKNTIYWAMWGIIYGIIRSCFMLPGIFLLMRFTPSSLPFIGVLMVYMGMVYFLAGRLAAKYGYFQLAVPIAEIVMGFLHGNFILIVASVFRGV